MKLKINQLVRAAGILAVSAITFFAASCSNSLINGEVASGNGKELKIAIDNYEDLVASGSESGSERTIISDSYTFDDSLDFYLYGESDDGAKINPTKVTIKPDASDKTVGTVTISAESANWTFTLAAVQSGSTVTKKSEMMAEAVLIGYSSVDMTNGDTAKFTLSTDGLTKKSTVAMKIYTDGWNFTDAAYADYTITAGIYKIFGGEDIGSTEKEINSLTNTAPSDANYSLTDEVAPGTYLFKVTFTKDSKTYVWSDYIKILPGKTMEESVGIPNVIGIAPSAPTDFVAAYSDGSEDTVATGYYTTELAWTRGSYNEKSYELDILELDSATALPASDTDWATAVSTGTVTPYDQESFVESEFYVSGALTGGNKNVQLKLALGKRYAARIRAVNHVGNSDYAYVTVGSDTTNGAAFTSTVINRYRITYVAQGGSYTENGVTAKFTPVVYSSEDTATGYTIPKYDGSDSNKALLTKKGYDWTRWDSDTTGTEYTETTYKGYENLTLYAKYTTDTEADVSIKDVKAYDIKGTWITFGTETLTESAKTVTITKEYEEGSEDTFKDISVTFKPVVAGVITDDFVFESVKFTFTDPENDNSVCYGETGFNVDTVSGYEFTLKMNGTGIGSGIYNANFIAYKGSSIAVSYPVTVTVEF